MTSLTGVFVVGALFGIIVSRFLPKLIHDQDVVEQRRQIEVAKDEALIAKLELARIEALEQGRTEGRAEALANYQIEIEPFYRESKIGLPGFKRRKVEIGHRYVLFVNGLPCLHPSEYVREEITECELDHEALLSLAMGRAESAVLAEGVGIAVKVLAARKVAEPEEKGT